eukprot:scaffold2202_cov72-Phaeocystis_antarctica.AAC.1
MPPELQISPAPEPAAAKDSSSFVPDVPSLPPPSPLANGQRPPWRRAWRGVSLPPPACACAAPPPPNPRATRSTP